MDCWQIMCVTVRDSKDGTHHVAVQQAPVRNALDGHDGVHVHEAFPFQSHPQLAARMPRPLISS